MGIAFSRSFMWMWQRYRINNAFLSPKQFAPYWTNRLSELEISINEFHLKLKHSQPKFFSMAILTIISALTD